MKERRNKKHLHIEHVHKLDEGFTNHEIFYTKWFIH